MARQDEVPLWIFTYNLGDFTAQIWGKEKQFNSLFLIPVYLLFTIMYIHIYIV